MEVKSSEDCKDLVEESDDRGAGQRSESPYLAGQQVGIERAAADLTALMEKDSQGFWCFKSLSRDYAKFSAIVDRLSAALQPTPCGEMESVKQEEGTVAFPESRQKPSPELDADCEPHDCGEDTCVCAD